MRLKKGTVIPRNDGKRIEEFVGNASTRTASVSVAKMMAPPGWKEPPQTPDFDEVVCVLKGTLTLVIDGKKEKIEEGEVGLVPAKTPVVYRNDARRACHYYSVCAPAFLPELAHMESAKTVIPPPRVLVDIGHPQGKPFQKMLAQRALAYLKTLGQPGSELSISLLTDKAITEINRKWRKKNEPTDVLSFPAGELPVGAPGPRLLGDIAISLDTARRQSKAYDRGLEEELSRYLAHGILHLLGHDHHGKAAAGRMAAMEEKLLGNPGMVAGGMPER